MSIPRKKTSKKSDLIIRLPRSRDKDKIPRPKAVKTKRQKLKFPPMQNLVADPDREVDSAEVKKVLGLLFDKDDTFEIRALKVKLDVDNPNSTYRHGTVSGFFTRKKLKKLQRELKRITEARGIYLTVQKLKSVLLQRRDHRLDPVKDSGECTAANDVEGYRYIFLDIDPRKADKHVAASSEERKAAHEVLQATANALYLNLGLPPGIAIDSGNGAYLLIPCDLPVSDEPFVEAFTGWAASAFSTDGAQIDTVTFNSARIMRLPGTINAKGDHCPDAGRPHRYAHLIADFRDRATGEELAITHDNLAVIAERCGFDWPPAHVHETESNKRNATRSKSKNNLERCRAYINELPPSIEGQNGSEAAFRVACAPYRFGLNDEQARELFLEFNRRCQPPWSESEIDHKLTDAKKKVEERGEFGAMAKVRDARTSQADALIELVRQLEVKPFRDSKGTCYVRYPVNDHWEIALLDSKEFEAWLIDRYYKSLNSVLSREARVGVIGVLSGQATFGGITEDAHLRVATLNEKIYVDLADDTWRAIEIDASGWRIVASPPVMFRRTAGMLALPIPVEGGSIEDLSKFLDSSGTNVSDRCVLMTAWLLGALRPGFPFPVLVLYGEQGAGKSSTVKLLRRLIDPHRTDLRNPPKDGRDLAISANNNHVVAIDNLSKIPDWLSDGLCRLSSGSGYTCRALYTNADETIFDLQRPVVINGIPIVADRGDLLDRALLVQNQALSESRRRTEAKLWADFNKAHPRILGALLTVLSSALKCLPGVHLDKLPRMADFALWVTAAEPALGWKPGTFMAAYQRSRSDADQVALESVVIGAQLQRLLAKNPAGWSGTATELLKQLEKLLPSVSYASNAKDRPKGWPSNAKSLSEMVTRLAPHLRSLGWEVITGIRMQGKRNITIRPVG